MKHGKKQFDPLKLRGNSYVIWRNTRAFLHKRAKGKCSDCSRKLTLSEAEIHHINGCGLDNHLQNLEVLCPSCHGVKTQNNGKQGELQVPKSENSFNSSSIPLAVKQEVYDMCFPRA